MTSSSLRKGQIVFIYDIHKHADLNGQMGIIESLDKRKNQYTVAVLIHEIDNKHNLNCQDNETKKMKFVRLKPQCICPASYDPKQNIYTSNQTN